MIRVAYVIDHLRVGGAQRHLLEVVRGLDRSRYAPEMWSAAAEPGDLAAVFEREGVPVRSFGITGTMLSPRTARGRAPRGARPRAARRAGGARLSLRGQLPRRAGRPARPDPGRRWSASAASIATRASTAASPPGCPTSSRDRVTVNAAAVREVVLRHEWCAASRIETIPNGVALPANTEQPAQPRGDRRSARHGSAGRHGGTPQLEEGLRVRARGRRPAARASTGAALRHRRRRRAAHGARGARRGARARRHGALSRPASRRARADARLRLLRPVLGDRGHAERAARGDGARTSGGHDLGRRQRRGGRRRRLGPRRPARRRGGPRSGGRARAARSRARAQPRRARRAARPRELQPRSDAPRLRRPLP